MTSLLRRSALAALLVVIAALATTFTGEARAAHDRNGKAVDGKQQSYRGARVSGGDGPAIAPELFFHGAKPNATWNATQPAGAEPQVQSASYQADPNTPGDPQAAYWQGDYTGTLDGALNIRWYWRSINPTSQLVNVSATVSVFRDIAAAEKGTPQPAKLVGKQDVVLRVPPLGEDPMGASATENINSIPVKGDVTGSLLIQVVTTYSDTGSLVETVYDSDDFPAGFQVLKSGTAGADTPASTPAPYGGEPFTVQTINVGRDSAEPTIGVNKKGTAFYAAGAFDALPGGSPRQAARTEVLRSRDGGITWESIQTSAPGDVTTLPPTTLDPYVYVDETTDRVFNPELLVACTYLQYSDNGGEELNNTSPAACGEYVNDHQTLFTGPPPANLKDQMGDYPNVVYYCFNRVADSNCGRSLDGGATWDPALGDNVVGTAYTGFDPEAGGFCGGLHGHGATDSAGRVFIPKGHCGFPWIAISEDGAQSWKRVRVSDKVGAAGTHLAVATDKADNLYFVWWDATDRLPYLATSSDHGNTWSKPLMIAPPGVHETNFPVIEAGDEGRIAINFPGTTVDNPDDKKRPWNQYIVASTNALAADPLFVSTTANPVNDPMHRGDCNGRCAGMFDFLDVIVSPHDGDIWATATDTCTNDVDDPEEISAEATNCVDNPTNANGNVADPIFGSAGVSNDEEGLAIRQLSGPNMLVGQTGGNTGGDGPGGSGPGGNGPGGNGPGGGTGGGPGGTGTGGVGATGTGALPATGGEALLLLLGATMIPAALMLGRRRD